MWKTNRRSGFIGGIVAISFGSIWNAMAIAKNVEFIIETKISMFLVFCWKNFVFFYLTTMSLLDIIETNVDIIIIILINSTAKRSAGQLARTRRFPAAPTLHVVATPRANARTAAAARSRRVRRQQQRQSHRTRSHDAQRRCVVLLLVVIVAFATRCRRYTTTHCSFIRYLIPSFLCFFLSSFLSRSSIHSCITRPADVVERVALSVSPRAARTRLSRSSHTVVGRLPLYLLCFHYTAARVCVAARCLAPTCRRARRHTVHNTFSSHSIYI